ncbi:glycosyl transferase family protein [Rhodospirillum centenum SW]|uniref:Glycosyl transferase family protein n=2 Tax=Rhodospirillum centenum TaxID=34018 RepID=B6IS19_RHOCS|nr:glycosyl transferase family protein [Rhodospirillum centenum SW]
MPPFQDPVGHSGATALLRNETLPLMTVPAEPLSPSSAPTPPARGDAPRGDLLVRLDACLRLLEASRTSADEGGGRIDAGVLRRELEAAGLAAARLEQRLLASDQELGRLTAELTVSRQELADRELRLREILASSSWRLSAPVRVLGRLVRRLRALLGRWGGGGAPALPATTAATAIAAAPAGPPALSAPRPQRPPPPDAQRLRIATLAAAAPEVSVIIPVFNQIPYTLACLDSIARALPRVPFEVIVVDDASSDATAAELAGRDDIRYLRNPENLGFVGACNRGAAEARGRLLMFLNNDTTVEPGWLDRLVETLERHPDAGLVGSKLIYPDGRLQEAGGIVFTDASGWNWGRLGSPDDPAVNYLRDVDYCSGAAILVRADLFRRLGGFDTRYAPAYYEDTDLAFGIRSLGFRVLYQPLSRVVHYEGVTSGTDPGAGIKRHQTLNRPRFLEKWQADLARHGSPADLPAAADRRPVFRMLVVDATTPTPDQDSGSVDMVNLLRIVSDLGGRVTFVPEDNFAHAGRYTEELQGAGVECIHAPFFRTMRDFLRARGAEFDVVLMARGPHAARHIDEVRRHCPQAPVIFDTVDLHFLRVERRAELTGDPALRAEAARLRTLELDMIRRCDATLVRSIEEKRLLDAQGVGERVSILPLIREVPDRMPPREGRSGVIFVGGFRHDPNVDAVRWFVAEVWPRVRRALPEAVFRIVGSNVPAEVAALAGDGVEVVGFVPDIAPLMEGALVSVAPLRYGAGLKGKLATSFMHGLPAVATPVAVEGMVLDPDEAVLVADDPAGFADAVIRLHRDEALWRRLAEEGAAFCRREFGLPVNGGRIARLLADLGVPVSGPADRAAAE